MHRRTAAMTLLGVLAWRPLRAQDGVDAADASAARAVIEAQLAAFRADDAQAAFALAAPQIRALFGSADDFVAMVRAGYAVVYRPVSVSFLQPEPVDGGVLQPVLMADSAGRGWIATYLVLRQPDGRWRIGGCEVERSRGQFT